MIYFVRYFFLIELKEFFRFIKGLIVLFRSRKIEVDFDVLDGCIFILICLMEVYLLKIFDLFISFKMLLMIVILRDEDLFNVM